MLSNYKITPSYSIYLQNYSLLSKVVLSKFIMKWPGSLLTGWEEQDRTGARQDHSLYCILTFWRIKLLEKATPWKGTHMTSRFLNTTFAEERTGFHPGSPEVQPDALTTMLP